MEEKTKKQNPIWNALFICLFALTFFLLGLIVSETNTGQVILYIISPEEFAYSQGEHFFAGTKGIPFHKGDSVIGEKIYLSQKGFVYRDVYIKESPYSGVIFDGIVNPTQEEVGETFEQDFFIHGIHFYTKCNPLTDRPFDVVSSREVQRIYHESFSNF